MHESAKHGLAIACRLSVCLSVCLSVTLGNRDHIGCNSSKIISRLVSLGCLLSADSNIRVYSKGNTLKFGPKITTPCWFKRRRHSIANCGRTVTAGDPIHFMFGSRAGFSGTADRTALFPAWTNPRWRPPPCWNLFQLAISPQPVVWSTSCLVLGWGFRGRRI